jgi:UDP-N-acetylglucosamine 1-carboxyvinyltransferase
MHDGPETRLIIEGGSKLQGTIAISGSKNAATPILAASLLSTNGKIVLRNIPFVRDVMTLTSILKRLSAKIHFINHSMIIDATNVDNFIIPDEGRKTRDSLYLVGPLLAKFKKVTIIEPGGDRIGKRPINFHLKGLQAFGARFETNEFKNGKMEIKADKLVGTRISLPYPSVGTTENLLMIASIARGKTVIENAAREPEVVDLARFLISMGAKIKGMGSPLIKIEGVKELSATSYTIIPDRIEAFTYMVASTVTGGKIRIINSIPRHMITPIEILRKIGVKIDVNNKENSIIAEGSEKYKPIKVSTAPYPGFPTDMQPLLTSLLVLSNGASTLTENVFPERFNHVQELRKMGAEIRVKYNSLMIMGRKKLLGAEVRATDIRTGAALILAGLATQGITTIKNTYEIDRGYERIEEKLKQLGAKIQRVNAD